MFRWRGSRNRGWQRRGSGGTWA
ncbi:unnamed protein product [Ectocarpus sp. CCAP 1310/34]|nr:unnamed protein product [Ectocarpus sp. CCAP 1310/34]